MVRKPLYIETNIACSLETLWSYTQEPHIHQQWDLRFSEIKYLPKDDAVDLQRFHYSTDIGFGISVSRVGESVATKSRNSYLQDRYLSIDYDNDPQKEMNKFAWLFELGVINGREFQVIREEIENSIA